MYRYTNRKNSLFLLIAIITGLACSCTKSANNNGAIVQLDISKKSLDSLKTYVLGNWEIHFEKGGIAGAVVPVTGAHLSIFANDSLFWIQKEVTLAKCRISWNKVRSGDVGDSSYILQYTQYGQNNTGSFARLAPVGLKNDTLILRQYDISDGFSYYMTRK